LFNLNFVLEIKTNNDMSLEELIKNNEGTIVDVRTPGEFMGGKVAGSINIPLNEIPSKLAEIKSLKMPLILCCASGNRSGQATAYLKAQGLDCHNGGSWLDVNYYQAQTVC
jgi:rhodanese-related sulfurtransferase